MKQVIKNSDNTIVLTLDEARCFTDPYYMMGIRDEQNDTWGFFILGTTASDESTDQKRYNQFTFNEPGEYEFIDAGFYSYIVWELPTNVIPPYFDPETKDGLLEHGRIEVTETVTDKAYENDTTDKTYVNG